MYKLTNRFNFKTLGLLVFFTATKAAAQDTTKSLPSLYLIQNSASYYINVKVNPELELVEIKSLNPTIVIDLKYAGSNNFTHQKIYPKSAKAFLVNKAAVTLNKIQQEFYQHGLGLKIYDAYRPYSATKKLWNLVKDERYAANPLKGSGHNRGVAVDLTIINLVTMQELDMGTGFDNFSDSSHHTFKNLSKVVLQNRLLLKTMMEKHGFISLGTEWWHYSLPYPANYPLLDLSFEMLKK